MTITASVTGASGITVRGDSPLASPDSETCAADNCECSLNPPPISAMDERTCPSIAASSGRLTPSWVSTAIRRTIRRKCLHARSVPWRTRECTVNSGNCLRSHGEIAAIAIAVSSVVVQSSSRSWVRRSRARPSSAANSSPVRSASTTASRASSITEYSARASRRAARRGSRGISAVAISATTPAMSPSTLRVNGPPAGSGSSTTNADCTAAATANVGLDETARATSSVTNTTIASCQTPLPMTSTSTSARTIPMTIPRAKSKTRLGRASRAIPRVVIVAVTATIGISWPNR